MAPDGSAVKAEKTCFHCGKPAEHALVARVFSADAVFCSETCRAIAESIEASGLSDYYAHREQAPGEASPRARAEIFDDEVLARSFVQDGPDGRSAAFLLEGVSCSACMWVIEQRLHQVEGITELRMDQTARQAYVTWDPAHLRVSDILKAVDDVGFTAHPFDPTRRESLREEERRRSVERLLLAGLMMMPVMGFQIATYWIGTEPDGSLPLFQKVGRWFVLAVTTLVLVYSGRDFFHGAWRDLKQRRAGMDVPIVLGLGVAWAGSLWATVTASGHVYFDSIVMFIFFLLAARMWELAARRRAGASVDRILKIMPQEVTRLSHQGEDRVMLHVLVPGDRIRLSPGEVVPVDARLVECESRFDESLMTGESVPVLRQAGEIVISGACNVDQPVEMIVARKHDTSTLATMQAMIRRGMSERPAFAMAAERVAPWFVMGVLGVAALTITYWIIVDPSQVVPNTVAVLIVTCPCALALATPVALAVAAGRMSDEGILAVRMARIEPLKHVDRIVFDKTGTLTLGHPAVVSIMADDENAALAMAAAMETGSEHPASKAILAMTRSRDLALPGVGPIRNRPGQGVELGRDGVLWRLGTLDFVTKAVSDSFQDDIDTALSAGHSVIGLSRDGELRAVFVLADMPRPGAAEAISALQATGIDTFILSGDRSETVARQAKMFGIDIDHANGGLLPEQKLAWVQAQQAQGLTVAMVGDGINDAPVLSAADVSFSFSEATDLARQTADFIVLNGDLRSLPGLITLARRSSRIIRQNLGWALAYNLLAIPAAAMGYVPPWAAAIGMSASSFVVVGNALRLRKGR